VPQGHERQRLDVYVPRGKSAAPLVVWVHGGAWRAGDKSRPAALGRCLEEGFAVASLNYRLSQHATFPAQLEDCKAAIRWLRAHAAEYGYDADRIGAFGASAGGHLVDLLGTTGHVKEFDVGAHLNASSQVQAVCSWFGPTDFSLMDQQAGARGRLKHDAATSPESMLVGGPIQEHPDKVRRANPITYVTADAPPFLLMHGDQDFTVPVGQSEILAEALRKAGAAVELRVVKGAGHGFGRDDAQQVEREVIAFFKQHLRRTAK
jgi:acetyl esterase/lipase